MLQKKMFLVIVLLMSLTFSGYDVAQASMDSESETEVRLLRLREVLLKSSDSYQQDPYVQADVRGEEMIVVVEDFEGVLEVEIYGLSGTGSVGAVYSVDGSGAYSIDISQLNAGFYLMKLHLGTTTYAGKFFVR